MSNCMYGAAHVGAAFVVRGKTGNTIGVLCFRHWREHNKELEERGYHLHTYAEMQARGELNDERTRSESAGESLAAPASAEPQQFHGDSPGSDSTRLKLASKRPIDRRAGGGSHGSPAVGHVESGGSTSASQETRETKEIVEVSTTSRQPPGLRSDSGEGRELTLAEPRPLEWWSGAGSLQLNSEQRTILQAPFPEDVVEIRYDGIVYVPWVFYWDRLLRAFDPFVPALIPVSKPYPVEITLCRDFVMIVNGVFIGAATGECVRQGGNQKLTYASAVEACKSDAITKVCKTLGMGQELFNPSWRAWFMSQYAHEEKDGHGRTRYSKRNKIEEHE